jgi:WD40-like Beta Propeller Repeat
MRKALVAKVALVVAVGALLMLPSVAGAVLSGANGRIAFISGRGATDAESKLYLRVAQGSFGLGLTSGPFAGGGLQARHPSWSPDRTKIAFAMGDAFCATDCDIYILDLTTPFPIALPIADTTQNEDRPAWSPDGTRIAYESEVTNGSGQVDILVDPLGEGATLNLTNTAGAGEIEGKPAWTPDSAEIYYHVGDPTKENSFDILKEPSGGGAVTKIAASPGENEFQPSLSPDGKQMCFTRGTKTGFNGTADVIVSLANGGGQQSITLDNVGEAAANGDYNCTWSPDGQFVTYVRGTFGTGDLVMERADGTTPVPVEIETAKGVFDGNPDWAPDGRPVCKDATVETGFNQPVTIPIECLDSGPFYERTQVQESAPEKTANGTLSEITQGDQEPSTVTYTPNSGFSGKDTFQINSFDKVAGFGEPKTITVNVAPPPIVVDDPPVVSNVKVTPRKAKAGAKLTVRWQLSEGASTKLNFRKLQVVTRRRGARRFLNIGTIEVPNGKAGVNTLTFQGRLPNGRKLSPGTYRVLAQARDAAGQLSKTSSSRNFAIVPKKG